MESRNELTRPGDPHADEQGATAVEYGLMVLLIAIAISATVSLIAPALNPIFVAATAAL